MCLHEEKHCPRCNKAFECKSGNIAHCQCSGVSLTEKQSAWINSQYDDCLCINCLQEIQHSLYVTEKEAGRN